MDTGERLRKHGTIGNRVDNVRDCRNGENHCLALTRQRNLASLGNCATSIAILDHGVDPSSTADRHLAAWPRKALHAIRDRSHGVPLQSDLARFVPRDCCARNARKNSGWPDPRRDAALTVSSRESPGHRLSGNPTESRRSTPPACKLWMSQLERGRRSAPYRPDDFTHQASKMFPQMCRV